MIRSEVKKKAQAHLHGRYGNWSLIAILPCAALFLYFFSVMFLFQAATSVGNQSNHYHSWQEDYAEKANRSMDDYERGYEDGYSDGYDDGFYQDDSDDDSQNEKNLHSLATIPGTSLTHQGRSVTYSETTTLETGIGGLVGFLVWLAFLLVMILYRGMIQWAAVDNVERRNFSLKTVFISFIKENGKRTVSANSLMALYTFLWSLLFVIPGVIKQLSYGMTNYLLKKDPTLTAKEAIDLSRVLMKGYKLEYLIFSYSFILWQFAAFFSFGLVSVYVIPYYSVSEVLFFDRIVADKHHLFTQEKEAGFADF
ncbi:hypothetical protein BCR22_06585 [Enterococcus plantarum]|uniref:DUF975 family protein n=1 Tax=Enterococcus plantarum TaxID=1077675 RepID=UPI00084D5B99|nr:DUF975 family protein [Enterococcus plantarum]MBO0421667.1 DUF975 family protein [Enterococcus plantarum]MBO0468105.1 DUF975 family protein [Enterococcus plantarum]OEG10112.1 hypothetical protein BCR22_06585 [Enterococcus plantarum]